MLPCSPVCPKEISMRCTTFSVPEESPCVSPCGAFFLCPRRASRCVSLRGTVSRRSHRVHVFLVGYQCGVCTYCGCVLQCVPEKSRCGVLLSISPMSWRSLRVCVTAWHSSLCVPEEPPCVLLVAAYQCRQCGV